MFFAHETQNFWLLFSKITSICPREHFKRKDFSNVLNFSKDFLNFARIFTCLEEQFREEDFLKNSKKKLEFEWIILAGIVKAAF